MRVRDACAVMHIGIPDPRWRGKRSRHSRRMRNPQFYVYGKKPMASVNYGLGTPIYHLTIWQGSLILWVVMEIGRQLVASVFCIWKNCFFEKACVQFPEVIRFYYVFVDLLSFPARSVLLFFVHKRTFPVRVSSFVSSWHTASCSVPCLLLFKPWRIPSCHPSSK